VPSPTQRSLKLLRDKGYFVSITERWNPFAHIRQDLYGFIDCLAIRSNETLAVQTTSGANVSARLEKMRYIPAVDFWLNSPSRTIEIHGWRKVGARGKRKVWECRVVPVTKETLRITPCSPSA
jgi:hypothetical protein